MPTGQARPRCGARNGEPRAVNTVAVRGDEVDLDDHWIASRCEASFQPFQASSQVSGDHLRCLRPASASGQFLPHRAGCDQRIDRLERDAPCLALSDSVEELPDPLASVIEPGLGLGRQAAEVRQPRFELSDALEEIRHG